jgi:WG containing repeat
MQKAAFLILFLFSTLSLFSQKTVDTNWGNGTLKTRVKLNGKDTTYVELHLENGQLCYQRWGKDSLVMYIADNIPFMKMFFKQKQPFVFSFFQADDNADSTVMYGGEGVIRNISVKGANKSYKSYQYENNKIKSITYTSPIEPTSIRTVVKDANGITRSVTIMDTAKLKISSIDSVFFKTGQLRLTYFRNVEGAVDDLKEYDKKGVQIFSYKKDTLEFKIAKDNAECLYGFTNQKDEWVVKAQYEDIKPMGAGGSQDYFIACGNGKCTILDKKGKALFPAQWDFLAVASEVPPESSNQDFAHRYYGYTSDSDDEFSSNYVLDQLKQEENFLEKIQFKCRRGSKYGLIDSKGKIIVAPNYEDIRHFYNGLYEVQIGKKWGIVNQKGDVIVKPNHFEIDFTHTPQYFIVKDTLPSFGPYERTITLSGLIDAKGNELLPIDYQISAADTMGKRFYVKTKGELKDFGYDFRESTFGIFNADTRKWELDTIYRNVGQNQESNLDLSINGKKLNFLEKINPINKTVVGKGILDSLGNVVLPFEYDELTLFTESRNTAMLLLSGSSALAEVSDLYLITKKGATYGLFNLTKRTWALQPTFENIQPLYLMPNNREYLMRNNDNAQETDIITMLSLMTKINLLTIKKDKKWQVVNVKGENLLKDAFDYICLAEKDANQSQYGGLSSICLVKNDKTTFISSSSFPLYSTFKEIEDKKTAKLRRYVELENGTIVLNSEAKVLMTPQYKTIFETPEYIIALDTIQQKQRIIYSDGKVKEFLPQYKILSAHLDKDLVIVEDPKTKLLGTVAADGKPLIPCAYFSILAPDENDIVWVKQDAPKVSPDSFINIGNYLITALDSAWFMFNSKGKQVSKSTFKYPFMIHKGVGVGMMNEKMGIWRNDGKMLLPPQYERIVLDTSAQMFYLFKRWADSSLAIGFADRNGKVIQEPRLDKMSPFFGNYALAFTGGQHALIDKKGQYVVQPFMNGFLNFKGSLFDSLWQVNLPIIAKMKMIYGKNSKRYGGSVDSFEPQLRTLKFKPPFEIDMKKRIDSLDKDKRNVLLNFLIEKTSLVDYIVTQYDFYQKHDAFFHLSSSFENKVEQYNQNLKLKTDEEEEEQINAYQTESLFGIFESRTLQEFSIENKYVGIAVFGALDSIKEEIIDLDLPYERVIQKLVFHNIAKGENGWYNIELNDILNVNRDNSLLINELLSQKIKLLKNENIDCSNPTIYFERSKDLFFVKEKGLEFYLPRQMEANTYSGGGWNHVPLLLTWDELKPFIKKKP